MSAWIGSVVLTLANLALFWRLGFSQAIERAKAWMALVVLYALWTVHLASLGRETAITSGLTALVFLVVSLHRFRVENPTGKVARFWERHTWLPTFSDKG